MRIVLQRVTEASVTVDDEVVGRTERGYMLLVGFGKGDSAEALDKAADKILALRLFPDEQGRFHHPLSEVSGGILAVPQFTLYADVSKGRRPDLFAALAPAEASALFDQFIHLLKAKFDGPVATGVFGASMKVQLINDGPVTIILEF